MEVKKVELARRVEQVCGRIPSGLGDILSVLTHPDVIELTKSYIEEVEKNDDSRKSSDHNPNPE